MDGWMDGGGEMVRDWWRWVEMGGDWRWMEVDGGGWMIQWRRRFE
jgi:hypothetical protein